MSLSRKLTVSVVIPAYHAAETIGEALGSVAAQTSSPHEVLVVDDASRDDTVRRVERCEGASCRIRVVRQRPNGGPGAARNRGIAEAEGEWIAFLDADDTWLPHRLAVGIELIRAHPEAAMFCGGTIEWGGRGIPPDGPSLSPTASRFPLPAHPLPLAAFAERNPVATSTVLVRKEVVREVGGFDTRFRGPEDYDLWLRIAARYPVVKTDQPLACYRVAVGSLSMDDRKFLPQVLQVLSKAYGPGGALHGRRGRRRAVAYQHLACAWMAMERGAPGRGCALLLRSLGWWPGAYSSPYNRLPWARAKLLRRLGRAVTLKLGGVAGVQSLS